MKTVQDRATTPSNHKWDAHSVPAFVEREDALPLQRAYRWEKERANEPFLTQPINGIGREWTWAQALDEARRVATFLSAQDWEPGSRVVILSKNCAWWLMAELAVWMSGHVSVPLFAALSAPSVRALMDHCEPVACFIGSFDDPDILTEAIPASVMRITFPNAKDPDATTWNSIVDNNAPLQSSPLRSMDDIATIMYTSGTTGTPKGAMHRFRSFVYFAAAVTRVIGTSPSQRMLSYLPLAHIAERALLESGALYCGYHLYFVERVETFMDDLKRARPTVFFSVPRLFIKFQQKVLAKIPQKKLDRLLAIPIVNRIVQRRILRELGLDQANIAASGGAALPMATLLWFRRLGLNLVEGYGMTETGITHTPKGAASHPGSVGDAVPGVEVRIDETGEVLVKSPMNMAGYFKNPQLTSEAFTDDGFFHTGDLGEVDEDGWLRIIGRLKEQFKTTKGKYVSPTPIEKLLCVHPAIEGCCVMGDGMASPFAVVIPSEQYLEALAAGEPADELEQSLCRLLSEVNEQLEAFERLQFIVVTDQPWTVANGYLTPTMKLKRSVLEASFARCLEVWSRSETPIVWHLTKTADRAGEPAAS
jgi:long-chain acyl-CoA synthetase